MTRLLLLYVAMIGLFTGCSRPTKSDVLSSGEFTREFAESLRNARPELKVGIINEKELKITTSDGREFTSFTDNAYDSYKLDTKAKADVLQRLVASLLETMDDKHDAIDPTRIVPIIKDRPWLDETRQALLNRGAKEAPDHVFEDFCPDLVIVYAEDTPKNIRYLTSSDLKKAKIERSELRDLAIKNLKRLLPKIERQGANGLYMMIAGGDYEASLLVLDSIWNEKQIEVQGEIVVAVPTRDLLLVTGSKNPQGIEKVKHMVKEALSDGSYRLSPKLFVYRKGKFQEFQDNADQTGTQNPNPQIR